MPPLPTRSTRTSILHEEDIQSALAAVAAGEFSSPSQAAFATSLSRSTLYRRQNGGKSRVQAREQQQNLTIAEEKALAK